MDCTLARTIIQQCLQKNRIASTDDEKQALDHVNNCGDSNACAGISVDYYEKFIKEKSYCPAMGDSYPNANFRQKTPSVKTAD